MYLVLEVITSEEQTEILQQLFFTDQCLGVEVVNNTTFQAIYPNERKEDILKLIDALNSEFEFQNTQSEIEDSNWNQKWEEDYQPIFIDNFCAVYAPFHQPLGNHKHELIINPEMAFGTGHHDTTQLMIEMIQDIDISKKTVLDLGSGTGVLAILAAKEGAKSVTAVDIDPNAVTIMKQNFVLNNEQEIVPILGQINSVSTRFDLILANITKNLILSESFSITERLTSDGVFICSGFLKNDTQQLINSFESIGFKHIITKTKTNWSSVYFKKH